MEAKGRVHVVYRRSAVRRETAGEQKEELRNEGRFGKLERPGARVCVNKPEVFFGH